MSNKAVFNRKEIKYIITVEQKKELVKAMTGHMVKDRFSDSHIVSVYMDTPTHSLIRRSMEKPVYKEKMRIRSYGQASNGSDVFIEIKKKYKGIVYKRRVEMQYENVVDYFEKGICENKNQIVKEMDYFKNTYENLKGAMYMSYYREAYTSISDSNLRITFDSEILARTSDVSVTSDIYGERLLDENNVVLEVKTLYGFPKWLNEFLSANRIYKTSFSKYGKAYKDLIVNKGEVIC